MTRLLALLCSAAALLWAQNESGVRPAPSTAGKERLKYDVSWATGLSLGEAELLTERMHAEAQDTIQFTFEADAAIPGFPIKESAIASSSGDLCSIRLVKKASRGNKRTDETVTFEQKQLKAIRQTTKGGTSEIAVPFCARDALTYLYFLRRELAQGRLPKTEKILYGGAYEIALHYAGVAAVRIGDETIETDRLAFTVSGPTAKFTFECSFARDPVRTPVLVRVPTPNGAILMEIMRDQM